MKVARKTISKTLWVVGLSMLIGLGGANAAFSVLGMPYSGVETFDEAEYTRFQQALTLAPIKDVEMRVLAYSYEYVIGEVPSSAEELVYYWMTGGQPPHWERITRVKYRVWVDRGHEFPYGNPIPYAEYLWQLLIVGGVIFGISFGVKPKAKSQR